MWQTNIQEEIIRKNITYNQMEMNVTI